MHPPDCGLPFRTRQGHAQRTGKGRFPTVLLSRSSVVLRRKKNELESETLRATYGSNVAIVIDPSLDTVRLYYRADEGSWTNLEMSSIPDDSYNASIPGQPEDSVVEYYITAEDTFGKTITALNCSDYFSYIVVAAAIVTTPPADVTPLIIGAIVVVVVIVVLVYIFIIRPKQETT